MLKKLFKRFQTPDEDFEDVPRYPPFMKGLPAAPVDRIMATQAELIGRVKQAVGVRDWDFEAIYAPLIRNYAAYVHLLPASESHHHRGAGGLFRHGLEVALWATQGSDHIMFAVGQPPEQRRHLEPRWRCGVFLAALTHDLGKPMSDLSVVDETGKHEWSAQVESLEQWLTRVGTRRYFLHWRSRRHKRHESLTPLVLPRVMTNDLMGHLQAAGPELYEQILFAVGSRDFQVQNQEHNPIFRLVREADMHSTSKDLSDPVAAGMPGALGVPLERYIMDAMHRLVREHVWSSNRPGARLWVIDEAVYVAWPAGGKDVVKALRKEKAPGIPSEPDSIADVLIDRGLAVPFDEVEGVIARLWPIQPKALAERNAGLSLYALRLDAHANLFAEQPASVEAVIGRELMDKLEAQAEAKKAGAQSPQTGKADDDHPASPAETTDDQAAEAAATDKPSSEQQPALEANQSDSSTRTAENNHAQPSEPGSLSGTQPRYPPASESDSNAKPAPTSERSEQPKPSDNNAPGAIDIKTANQWLGGYGHIGAIVKSVAKDFRDGHKKWQDAGVTTREGLVAIRHPEGWKGCGVATREILPMLQERGWVEVDPFQAIKKVRDIPGFTGQSGSLTRPAIVLPQEASAHFLAIAGAPAVKQSRKEGRDGKPASGSNASKGGQHKRRKGNKAGQGGQNSQTGQAEQTGQTGQTGEVVKALRAGATAEPPALGAETVNHKLRLKYGEALTYLTQQKGFSNSQARQGIEPLICNDSRSRIEIHKKH